MPSCPWDICGGGPGGGLVGFLWGTLEVFAAHVAGPFQILETPAFEGRYPQLGRSKM